MQRGVCTTGNCDVPFAIFGSGERTMLLLNGAQQTRAAWRSVIKRFSHCYRIVTFDPPGQGAAAGGSTARRFSLAEHVEIAAAVANAANASGRLTLVGASWGGFVGAAFAAEFGNTVETLVLASIGVQPNPILLKLIEEGQGFVDAGQPEALGRMIVNAFGDRLPHTMRHRIVRQFATATANHLRSFYQQSAYVATGQRLQDIVDLRAIVARTAIVKGAEDPLIDEADIAVLMTIPNVEYISVPNAGHFLHWERPEIVELYAEFLSKDWPEPI
jgi:pimeloyl-ACP methyl ester carboxylesterase